MGLAQGRLEARIQQTVHLTEVHVLNQEEEEAGPCPPFLGKGFLLFALALPTPTCPCTPPAEAAPSSASDRWDSAPGAFGLPSREARMCGVRLGDLVCFLHHFFFFFFGFGFPGGSGGEESVWVRSLGREDPLEKEMATHSSILAWEIPWTEEPGGLQSMGSQRGPGSKESRLTHTLSHTHTHTSHRLSHD